MIYIEQLQAHFCLIEPVQKINAWSQHDNNYTVIATLE